MKVVQTVFAKFHHFDLARQLHRQGMLEAIYTGYPRWKLRHEGLPQDKIRTFPWVQTVLMGKWRHGFVHPRLDRELAWLMAQTLDGHVAAHLPECDVFVGISGSGLKTSCAVKRRNGRYICDRGSSHIRYADQVLRAEFARWGQSFPGVDPRAIKKEESEYAAADVITLPSGFCVRSFEEMGIPAAKLRKISYGVDLSRFSKEGHPPTETFEVLFVGQVSFRKGVPYLLAAFERLNHPKKRLRIVGAMQPEMELFLREKRWDGVEFTGPVPQEELVGIMSTSHVMVLPSVEDGLGLVLGQAMACGCPCICSANTGGEDLFEHGQEGFVVPIRDPEAIAARLEELCQNRTLRDRMGDSARQRVKAIGGWDDYGNEFGRLCREMTGEAAETRAVRS